MEITDISEDRVVSAEKTIVQKGCHAELRSKQDGQASALYPSTITKKKIPAVMGQATIQNKTTGIVYQS